MLWCDAPTSSVITFLFWESTQSQRPLLKSAYPPLVVRTVHCGYTNPMKHWDWQTTFPCLLWMRKGMVGEWRSSHDSCSFIFFLRRSTRLWPFGAFYKTNSAHVQSQVTRILTPGHNKHHFRVNITRSSQYRCNQVITVCRFTATVKTGTPGTITLCSKICFFFFFCFGPVQHELLVFGISRKQNKMTWLWIYKCSCVSLGYVFVIIVCFFFILSY